MDAQHILDGEIIADSEDEENDWIPPISIESDQLYRTGTAQEIMTPDISNHSPRPPPNILNHNSSACLPDASSANDSSIGVLLGPQSGVDCTMSNIAERAKMSSRSSKSQARQALSSTIAVIELSSSDGEFCLPSSRKRKNKTHEKRKNSTNSKKKLSSEATDGPPLAPRPRPRPRPIGKSKQSNPSSQMPPNDLMSQPNNSSSTSSVSSNQFPIPFHLLSSPPPPSGPSTSTSDICDHPPIEILPQIRTAVTPPSSPSSLFSVTSRRTSQEKVHTDQLDQLESDTDPLSLIFDQGVPSMLPPSSNDLPTFFAGSSPCNTTIANPSARKDAGVKGPRKNIPKPWIPETTASSKRKSKKKQETSDSKVEVVIGRPRGKRKMKATPKGQAIDTDEDRLNAILTKSNSPRKPNSLTSLSSLSYSDTEEMVKALPRKKHSSHAKESRLVGQSKPGDKPKVQSNRKGLILSSDDEEICKTNDEVKKPAALPVTDDNYQGKTDSVTVQTPSTPALATKGNVDNFPPGNQANYLSAEEHKTYLAKSPKENLQPASNSSYAASSPVQLDVTPYSPLSSRYEIAPKTKSTPMSDLIRRVNSKPGSPFFSPASRGDPRTVYSPYTKASRNTLSRIAPLHLNRRTPPPPLPPPPPRKKTKKELEREEKWEDELIESAGGISEWACMTDAERKELRKAKRQVEMYGWEE